MTRRVLLVGAGKRAQETAIPALMALGSGVELAGVWARSSRKLKLYGGEFTAQTETGPEAFPIAEVDTIIVAVTRSQVPAVLRSLRQYDTSHAALMLDTPVLDPGDWGATAAFRRFRRVVCSEDAIALPPVAAARTLIEDGAVGAVRSIHFFHSGWRNHALASIRSMLGGRKPTRITVRRSNAKWSETRYRFPGGVRAMVVQPHLHGHGRMLIVGDRGAIADYETGRSDATQIGYVVEDGVFRGVTVGGERVEHEHDRLMFENLPRGLEERTLDNMFKIRGFMELVAGVADDASPYAYDPFDAIYDHQCLRLAERLPAFVDPRLGRRSLLGGGIRALAGIERALKRG